MLLAGLAMLGAGVWRPLLAVAVAGWALAALAAVLDARLRTTSGTLAGLVVALLGPLALLLLSLSRRRAVRKVTHRYRGAVGTGAVMALMGAGVAFAAGDWALGRLAYTIEVPSAGMAPRISSGDRVLVSPLLLRRPTLGEIVAVAPFPRAEPFGARGRVFSVLRVVGEPGDWVGATSRGYYRCRRPPDIAKPITRALGCRFPDETGYTVSRTQPFGPVPVPRGTFYLMGDDRQEPGDSREFWPVPAKALAGRVVATVWPAERLAVR